MSRLQINVDHSFKSGPRLSQPGLQVVSREPFSPVASFLLGLIVGLAAATGIFVLFFQ